MLSHLPSRRLAVSKSRSQIFRPLSPVLDAVSRLLRPLSAQSLSSKTAWTANDPSAADAAPVPSAPEPPSTPEDRIVPISPSPSTCGSSTSSVPNWTPDHGIVKRRRFQRYADPDADHQPPLGYRQPAARVPPRQCNVLEKIVLELFDVQQLDWMMIAEPLQRLYGLDVDSAAVLGILQDHGRIQRTVWWD